MAKRPWALVVLAAVLALVAAACLRSPGLPIVALTSGITITDFKFDPDKATVKKGEPVTFTNQDAAKHTIAPGSSGKFAETEAFGQGQSATLTFEEAGTIAYICGIHPFMKGTITVEE